MNLNTIREAIEAIANGELIVVVDDGDRENEGDLIMAASKATPEQIAFMVRHTSGIICAPMSPQRADHLNLAPMVANNRDPMRTAFTVSVDYKVGLTTGISADERSSTLRALANNNSVSTDFLRPGHVFPLVSKPGGVLTRSGHTEAAIDLARLAGLEEVGVLAEVVNDDGTVKRLPQLLEFAKEHNLKIISIEDLIEHRVRSEPFVSRVETTTVATPIGPATAHIYASAFETTQHLAIVFGHISEQKGVPCRIHHEQPLRDLFGSQTTSQLWLENAFPQIKASGRGVIIFVRDPKIAAFDQDPSSDEGVERHQSTQIRMKRWREVGLGAQILRDLGVTSISLVATQHRQYVGLSGFGIEIVGTTLVQH
ncbi:3,4-dihydroxy-2-butanone-4-phosphate synthase [Microvirga sp. TS319]|uniref:3,4-dihydroxy-2-butanone-4-phosphate synthase n=1 Tax=Microvirga sp. TS319 TaxID=3241165 RepID=UPI00351A7FDE